VIKATALTKAFELERVLLDDGNVEQLFNGDSVSSSLLQTLASSSSGRMVSQGEPLLTSLLDGNELFRWLVEVTLLLTPNTLQP